MSQMQLETTSRPGSFSLEAAGASIRPIDSKWLALAQAHLDRQTRPQGSMGRLETIAARLAAVKGTLEPSCVKKRLYIFAADHGVEQEGVSAYPREVTSAMVRNFLAGGATVSVFARLFGVEVVVADVGVDGAFDEHPSLLRLKIRRATSNMRRGPAMTRDEALAALAIGWNCAVAARRDGVEVLAGGEMGIANTTAATAVLAGLSGLDVQALTGRGTGLADDALARKIQVIQDALRVNQHALENPLDVLASVGGFEIGALAGLALGAAGFRIPFVVDGWIATAGALAAIEIQPAVRDFLFFGHCSAERGHEVLMRHYGFEPILDLKLRLGEGTGACLAMPILEAASRMLAEVATFDQANVPERNP